MATPPLHPKVLACIEKATKRRQTMQALRARGWTLQRIADRYGISRERVRQVLRGRGIASA